jgi:hypothetical protein
MSNSDLSPAMKIFNWRGDHATDRRPELLGVSAPDFAMVVAEDTPWPPSLLDVRHVGFVVCVAPDANLELLTGVLRAVRDAASTPPPVSSP